MQLFLTEWLGTSAYCYLQKGHSHIPASDLVKNIYAATLNLIRRPPILALEYEAEVLTIS